MNDEHVQSIAPYVIQVLTRSGFFDLLDHRLCPEGAGDREKCGGDFAISKSLLDQIGFTSEDQADIFAVLGERGAGCDCEILYNVVLESRLKKAYWRAAGGPQVGRFAHGSHR